MPAKTAQIDPAAIRGWIADARKKPISFALLAGSDGLILQADKVKSPDQMRKSAKAAGGGKGCWGKMEVRQKTLVLTYQGNPPSGFEKRVRKLLSDAGAAMRVEMTSLEEMEAAADAQVEEEERAKSEAAADKRKSSEVRDAAQDETLPPRARPIEDADPDDLGDREAEDADGEGFSDLPTVLKLARKRPLNFACLLGSDGVVLITHRSKNWGILVKQAKSLGGSAKGGWGTLGVEGKQVILTCVEDPPGTLARRLKLKLRSEGQNYSVVIRSPAGETVEPDEDGEGSSAESVAGVENEGRGHDSQKEQLEHAYASLLPLLAAATEGENKGLGKKVSYLSTTFREEISRDEKKAAKILTVLQTTLDKAGIEATDTADVGANAEFTSLTSHEPIDDPLVGGVISQVGVPEDGIDGSLTDTADSISTYPDLVQVQTHAEDLEEVMSAEFGSLSEQLSDPSEREIKELVTNLIGFKSDLQIVLSRTDPLAKLTKSKLKEFHSATMTRDLNMMQDAFSTLRLAMNRPSTSNSDRAERLRHVKSRIESLKEKVAQLTMELRDRSPEVLNS